MNSVRVSPTAFVGMTALLALVLGARSNSAETAKPFSPIGSGELVSLSVFPAKVKLVGTDDMQQIVVTGHFANGGVADLTRDVEFQVGDASIVNIESSGLVIPLGSGKTDVVAQSAGKSVKVQVTVEGTVTDQPINFANEIVPILTKLGCNNGGCHGKADGQNGFKLSLLGFDAAADYEALVHEGRGRRVIQSAPQHSLLLLKPTGQLGHGGGKAMKVDSPEYKLISRWIRSATPYGNESDPKVIGIEVSPGHRLLGKNAQQQITVTAKFSDGTKADVTRRAEFRTNDAELVDASETGLVETLGRFGEGSIMIRYLGHVAIFRGTIPLVASTDVAQHEPNNFVDQLAFAKHRQLGFVASDLCTDNEFLRRASLDIIGTLPTSDEVKTFTASNDPKKREKLIEDLLSRPEYAKYFALTWADILRVRGGSSDNEKTKIEGLNTRAVKFHEWIRQSLQDNKPYDQFVREIITTDGDTTGKDTKAPILWYLELKNAQGLVEDTGQAFLGTRIQCAQCHHHPFEKWSQDDYWSLASFFARVQWQTGVDRNGKPAKDRKPIRVSESARVGQYVGYDPQGKLTDPQGKVYELPAALDCEPMTVAENDDPRHKLVDWMVAGDNPFFACALVNRYWGHFFGRGIVEPIDDMRVTNPPSNPELLDALAKNFIEHKFDLKHLIRTLCNSKTYQLSSTPNEYNRDDTKHFARFLPRRLPAEVLYDAVDQVTGNSTKFRVAGEKKPVELEIRAIERPHMRVSTYFLDVFGINKRDSACECGRESNVTLAQRVHLLNGREMQAKLSALAAKLAPDPRPVAEKITETYLKFFARPPTGEELKSVEEYITTKAKDERKKNEAYQDFLWALLNTKEFIFQH